MSPKSPEPQENEAAADAWEGYVTLVTGAQPGLLAFVRSLLPREADARDVVQETNLVLWKKRADYDTARPFMPWVCGIAANQTKAYLKKRYRDDWIPFDETLVEQIAEQSLAHAETVEERRRLLKECVQKLPERQRRLVELRYTDGASVKGIASLLGRSVDAISMTLFRARQNLTDCVERLQAGAAE